jgi:putative oxidoreductase
MRSIFPPFMGGPPAAGLLVLRAVSGVAFMFHGWKLIHDPFGWMGPASAMPAVLQALAALSEFGGGLCWILGLLTPLASFGILCTMGVALSMHVLHGDPFVGRPPAYELALVYFSVALLLLLRGPGVFSLDALLFRRPPTDT